MSYNYLLEEDDLEFTRNEVSLRFITIENFGHK